MTKRRMYSTGGANGGPGLSLVMPCYNEEEIVGYTIPQLLSAFDDAGYRLQLIAVDNGSHDETGQILNELADQYEGVISLHIDHNEGYGNGILQGLPLCSAPWIGIIPADGQVDAVDVVRLYEAVLVAKRPVLGKVRRRFRMDGFRRKVVSILYNAFMLALWPNLGSLDVNGTPKLIPRDVLRAMQLKSTGWLLDAEIMIKATDMGVRVLELNAFARMRSNGISHVRVATCWEFLHGLLTFRFSPQWREEFAERSRAVRKGDLSRYGNV